jgi:hypothetical protein
LLAFSRAECEQEAYEYLLHRGITAIADVGGSPVRHKRYGRAVHSLCPFLTPSDVVAAASHTADMAVCNHKMQDCPCLEEKQIRGLMFVHSIYYVTAHDILTAMERCGATMAVSVHHRFPDGWGAIGEASYFRSRGRVRMEVAGGDVFEHDDLAWLAAGIHSNATSALAWRTHRQRLGTEITVFSRTAPVDLPARPERVPSTFGEFLHEPDTTYVLNRDQRAAWSRFATVPVRDIRLRNYGPFVVAHHDRTRDVPIPVKLITDGALQIAGKERSPENFTALLRYMRNKVKELHVPETIAPVVIIEAAALAFVSTIDSEANAYNTVSQHPGLAVLARVRRFNNVWPISFQYILVALLTCLLWLFFSPTIAAVAGVPAVLLAQRHIANLDHPGYDFIAGGLAGRMDRLYGRVSFSELKPMRPGTTCIVPDDMHDGLPRPDTRLVGLVTADYMSPTFAATRQNELVALRNRSMHIVPHDVRAVCHFTRWVQDNFDTIFADRRRFHTSFDAWNARYPATQREQHKRAYDELRDGMCSDNDVFRRSVFTKREPKTVLSRINADYGDPRVIVSATPHLNVMTGPSIRSFYRCLKHLFPMGHVLAWPSGASAEEAGAWIERCDSTVEIFENDCSRWDGSVHRALQDLEIFIITRLVGDPCVPGGHRLSFVLQKMQHAYGYTRFGIKFQLSDVRNSGDQNTASGNYVLNMLINLYAYCHCTARDPSAAHLCEEVVSAATVLQGKTRFSSMTLGDDNIRCCEPGTAANAVATYTAIGFVAKATIHPGADHFAAEFAGGLFYPAVRGHQETHVLGPKLGRCLPKFGTLRNEEPAAPQLRGIALGLHATVNHVPVLRDAVARTLQLTTNATARAIHERQLYAREPSQLSERIWNFLEQRYGYDQAVFDRLAAKYRQASLGDHISDEAFHTLVARDLGVLGQVRVSVEIALFIAVLLCGREYGLPSTTLGVVAFIIVAAINGLSGATFGNNVAAVTIAPLIEEVAKRTWCPMLPLFEFSTRPSLLSVLPVLMHEYSRTLSLPHSVLAHATWNALWIALENIHIPAFELMARVHRDPSLFTSKTGVLAKIGEEVTDHVLLPLAKATRGVWPAIASAIPNGARDWIARPPAVDRPKGPRATNTTITTVNTMNDPVFQTKRKATRNRAAAGAGAKVPRKPRTAVGAQIRQARVKRAATAQLASRLVSNAANVRNRPVSRMRGFKDGIVIEGSDFLQSIGDLKVTSGTSLISAGVDDGYYINPQYLPVPFLNSISLNFEAFYFERCDFEFVPSAPNTRTGSMVGYFDRDSADVLDANLEFRVRAAYAHTNNLSNNLFTRAKWSLPPTERRQYYVDTEDSNTPTPAELRQNYQAVFRLLVDDPSDITTSPGRLLCHWRVRLWQKKLDANVAHSSSGLVNYYTMTGNTSAPVFNAGLVSIPGAWATTLVERKGPNVSYTYTFTSTRYYRLTGATGHINTNVCVDTNAQDITALLATPSGAGAGTYSVDQTFLILDSTGDISGRSTIWHVTDPGVPTKLTVVINITVAADSAVGGQTCANFTLTGFVEQSPTAHRRPQRCPVQLAPLEAKEPAVIDIEECHTVAAPSARPTPTNDFVVLDRARAVKVQRGAG